LKVEKVNISDLVPTNT